MKDRVVLKLNVLNEIGKEKPKKEVLCYFHCGLLGRDVCRVGYYDSELKKWIIDSDGYARVYNKIDAWIEIPPKPKN